MPWTTCRYRGSARAAAEQELVEASGNYDDLQARLSDISSEKTALLERFREEGENLKELTVENAKRSAEKIKQDAIRQVEVELNRANEEIRSFIVSEAIKIAEEKVSAEIDQSKDKALRAEAVELIRGGDSVG